MKKAEQFPGIYVTNIPESDNINPTAAVLN
jgi:hypothetical protein